MSDDEMDMMNMDSDDDDFGLVDEDGISLGLGSDKGGSGTPNKPMTQAEKRAHHNMLERKRRDHIKDSFVSLRDSVPALQGEKSSRAQILKKAAEYIQFMKRKNSAHQHDIEDLKRQNHILENQIRSLERARMNGGRPSSTNGPLDNKVTLRSNKGNLGGLSESDNSDGEFRNMSSPESITPSNGTKKLKTTAGSK